MAHRPQGRRGHDAHLISSTYIHCIVMARGEAGCGEECALADAKGRSLKRDARRRRNSPRRRSDASDTVSRISGHLKIGSDTCGEVDWRQDRASASGHRCGKRPGRAMARYPPILTTPFDCQEGTAGVLSDSRGETPTGGSVNEEGVGRTKILAATRRPSSTAIHPKHDGRQIRSSAILSLSQLRFFMSSWVLSAKWSVSKCDRLPKSQAV